MSIVQDPSATEQKIAYNGKVYISPVGTTQYVEVTDYISAFSTPITPSTTVNGIDVGTMSADELDDIIDELISLASEKRTQCLQ